MTIDLTPLWNEVEEQHAEMDAADEADRTAREMFAPKWIVCPECDGEGTSSSYLGTFTARDIEEMGEEFMQDYMNGAFDRACPLCHGRTTVTQAQIDDYCEAARDQRIADRENGIY